MMLRGQGGGGGGGGGRCLFTASQWRELEHQALIYKYMAAGSQVPHELVVPLRHNDAAAVIDTVPTLACFPPPQPSLGWGLYGMGAQYARKPEDPEPGRCRRTDGKKWRCSREAYGESKYCDRHMHRGKNRSRKPVEPMPSSNSTATSTAVSSYRPSALSISPPTPADAPAPPSYGHYQLRPDPSAARSTAQINPLQLHLDAPSPPPSYHRYAQAQYGASPLYPSGGGYGYGLSRQQEQEEAEAMARRRQHCLALGADLSLDKPDSGAAAASLMTTEEKPLRRFLDECPREENSVEGRPWYTGMGHRDETQLSMSIPTTARYLNHDG